MLYFPPFSPYHYIKYNYMNKKAFIATVKLTHRKKRNLNVDK